MNTQQPKQPWCFVYFVRNDGTEDISHTFCLQRGSEWMDHNGEVPERLFEIMYYQSSKGESVQVLDFTQNHQSPLEDGRHSWIISEGWPEGQVVERLNNIVRECAEGIYG